MKSLKFVTGLALSWGGAAAQAAGLGVGSLAATGGLHTPSAYVLPKGDVALSLGNDLAPKLGDYSWQRNYSLGFGLGGGVELFGRLTDYVTPNHAPAGRFDFTTGIRDISANVKWQLPLPWTQLPKIALGLTDLSGGAVHFKSAYAVASDEAGPVRWSLGFAQGKPAGNQPGRAKVLDGTFGGVEVLLGSTRATALLEHDGTDRHVGLRYYSEPIAALGQAQLVGSVQRSIGAVDRAGAAADANRFNVSLVLPMQADYDRLLRALPAADAVADETALEGMTPWERLHHALNVAGLDRVRVGSEGAAAVVEYENQRYLHNEVDALGLVLGLAAQLLPESVQQVRAIALKSGGRMMQARVDATALRDYLQWGSGDALRASVQMGSVVGYDPERVQWMAGTGERVNWVRLQLKPLVNYTVGTEYGILDYSAAAQLRASVSLWPGAQIYAEGVEPLDSSPDMRPGGAFASLQQRGGLQTLAVQQSLWLGRHLFVSAGTGRYLFNHTGVEGEAMLMSPWNDDSLHVRARSILQTEEVDLFKQTVPQMQESWSASYRWRPMPGLWVEAGWNRYTDQVYGPTFAVTRWLGDMAVQAFARSDDTRENTYVGLAVSFPLTPRRGMAAAPVQLAGSPRFGLGLRTLLTNSVNTGNWVRPSEMRPVPLAYSPETEELNSGRFSDAYLREQLPRLRESFHRYGRSATRAGGQ